MLYGLLIRIVDGSTIRVLVGICCCPFICQVYEHGFIHIGWSMSGALVKTLRKGIG